MGFLDTFFKSQPAPQQETASEQETDHQAQLAAQLLEIEKQKLDLQERQLRQQDPTYAEEQELKNLNPDDVIEKLGFPVDLGGGKVGYQSKDAVDYYFNKNYKPQIDEAHKAAEETRNAQNLQHYKNVQIPEFTETVYRRHQDMFVNRQYVDPESFVQIFNQPHIAEMAAKGGIHEREAVRRTLEMYDILEKQAAREAKLAMDYSDDGGEEVRRPRQTSESGEPELIVDSKRPEVHFVLVDKENQNIMTDEGLEHIAYLNNVMGGYQEAAKTGQPIREVKYGTLDTLKRLQKQNGHGSIRIDRSLVAS